MIERWLYGRYGFLFIVLVGIAIAGAGVWIILGISAWDAVT